MSFSIVTLLALIIPLAFFALVITALVLGIRCMLKYLRS